MNFGHIEINLFSKGAIKKVFCLTSFVINNWMLLANKTTMTESGKHWMNVF